MAQTATVVSQQTLQFDVPGGQTTTRVSVTTGLAQFNVGAFSQNPNQNRQSDVIKLLVDPVLAPGQFRKATAMVSFANVQRNAGITAGEFTQSSWSIDDTSCSLDDESGKVELRFQVTVLSGGTNSSTNLSSAAFQVTSVATL
jgi:hypothetical protein